MSDTNITAQIIRLPGAAAQPVKQHPSCGPRSKSVISFDRFLEIKKLQGFIRRSEEVQQWWRDDIAKLRQDARG